MMPLIRTYRFPLRPLAHQREALELWLWQCYTLYNNALQQRRDAWKKHGKSVTYNDQTRDLTDLRKEEVWGKTPVDVQRSALRRLATTFEAFFRRVKAGDTPGYPRFRGADRYNTIGLGQWARSVIRANGRGDGYVHVPKLGRVRFRQHRAIEGEVRNVEITRDARGRWFVQISCDVGAAPPKRVVHPGRATGIDLGLTSFAVLRDGTEIDNPRFGKRAADKLARGQRILALKKRGSNSRKRAKRAVARAYERVVNQRKNFHHQVAAQLCARYDLIAHEDLNVKGLARGMLAKSVHDAAWAQFISILTHKAESAGVYVIAVDPRGTTQECSDCGVVVPKTLSERMHRCTHCGLVLGRDHNAAINILARGLRAVPLETAAAASS